MLDQGLTRLHICLEKLTVVGGEGWDQVLRNTDIEIQVKGKIIQGRN